MEKIRRAEEADRREVVECILDAFQKDFAEFINKVGRDKVQNFLEAGLRIHCFYVMELEREIIAVLALSNIRGRAMRQTKKAAQNSFGALFGGLLYMANFKDFDINYCTSKHTACIEFVAVRQDFRGRGLASILIKRVISETGYKSYILDVVDTNHAAIKCYSKLNFVETKREKVRFSKQRGFKEKIFMEYRRKDGER
ncbi:MAG: GNAT family N-acetyltransferase [Filifactor alocis]|nr:GNAT family N-acetyltransferase [Filifactor alocis]